MAALAERDRAETAQDSLRRSLYASDVQLAQAAWNSGNPLRMQQLLEGQKPRAGETDLRGFEWHYLRRLGSIVRSVRIGPGATWGGLSPDGTQFVLPHFKPGSGQYLKHELLLEFWDLTPRTVKRTISPFPGELAVTSGSHDNFSADGKRFAYGAMIRDAAGQEHFAIRVWEWGRDPELRASINLPGFATDTTLDRAGQRLATAVTGSQGEGGCDIKIWAVDGGKEALTIPLPGQWPSQLAFSPDGSQLAALTQAVGRADLNADREIRVWDSGTGKETSRFAPESGSSSLAFSPDGKRLAVSRGGLDSLWLYDASSGKRQLELTKTENVAWDVRPAFSPDGSLLAIGSGDGKVSIWDVSATAMPNAARRFAPWQATIVNFATSPSAATGVF